MVLRISVVSPCDNMADQSQWLTVAAQHHEKTLWYITSSGKVQSSKFEVWFLLNAYHFHIQCEVEKS